MIHPRWLLSAFLCLLTVSSSVGRQFTTGESFRPDISAGISINATEFTFDGFDCIELCETTGGFTFSEPMYGIVISRREWMLSLARGTQKGSSEVVGDRELITAAILAWTALRPFGLDDPADLRVFVPVGLHSGYRKLSRDGDAGKVDEFESTVIGIGVGIGAEKTSRRTRIAARVIPFVGVATRSVGFGQGTTTMLDADVEVSFGPAVGKFGIMIGYGFRWQKWSLDNVGIMGSKGDQEYRETRHGFRLGVSW